MNAQPLTDDQIAELEQLAMHRAKVAEEMKNLEAIRKDYDAKIADLAGEGTTAAGAYKVTVTVPRRLDTAKLEQAFPIAQHPTLYAAKLDTTAVKDNISKVALAEYQTAGSPTVRIS